MPCDLERERKNRESELKREVSFLPFCFIYEGCWCSHGSDSWMEGREERRAEERSVHREPLRKLLASSLLALHFPLLHTANSGMRVFSPDDAFGAEFLLVGMEVAFRIKQLAYKCSYQLKCGTTDCEKISQICQNYVTRIYFKTTIKSDNNSIINLFSSNHAKKKKKWYCSGWYN